MLSPHQEHSKREEERGGNGTAPDDGRRRYTLGTLRKIGGDGPDLRQSARMRTTTTTTTTSTTPAATSARSRGNTLDTIDSQFELESVPVGSDGRLKHLNKEAQRGRERSGTVSDLHMSASHAITKMAAKQAAQTLLGQQSLLGSGEPLTSGEGEMITLTYSREYEHVKFIRWPHLHQCWLDASGQVLIRAEEERSAGFVELFFDLVFVVILAALANSLFVDGPTFHFFVQAIAVIRLWKDSTVYLNLFDAEDILHKIMLYFMMLGVLGLAIGRNNDSLYVSRVFSGSFIWVRFFLILLHLWCAMIKKARVYCFCISAQFVLSAAFWVASMFVQDPLIREGLWFSALAFDYIGDVVRSIKIFKPLPVNLEHIEERFGLFMIILIGENVAAAFFTETGEFNVRQYAVAALALFLSFCFQQLYHDVENGFHGIPRRSHAHYSHRFMGWLWNFTHLPLSISFVVLASAIHGMIAFYAQLPAATRAAVVAAGGNGTAPVTLVLPQEEVWEFVVGLAGALLFCSIIGWSHDVFNDRVNVPKPIRVLIRVMVSVFLVLSGLIDYWRSEPLALVGLGSVLTVGVISLEMERKEHHPDLGETDGTNEITLAQDDGVVGM